MGNSPYKTSTNNSLENQIYIDHRDNSDNSDNSDNQSASTVIFDTTYHKNSQSYLAEVYVRRNYRRRAIIVAKTSKSCDETEIQNENAE